MEDASCAPTGAYDTISDGYELLTADWDYEPWIAAIEDLAVQHGLSGKRLLDVACGAGKSFLPFVARGYDVTACDLSAAMADAAARHAGPAADVLVADMRKLPRLGSFDLVTCLDDSLNHLTSVEQVAATFAGIRANLGPRGLFVFDVNTLAAYREAQTMVVEDEHRIAIWHGERARLQSAGGTAEVRMQVLRRRHDGAWTRAVARWPHRHYDVTTLRSLLERSGLRLVAVRGQRTGGRLEIRPDENRHPKLLLLARRKEAP